jgi:hypothetical protein
MAITSKRPKVTVTIKIKTRDCHGAGKYALEDYQLEFEGDRAFLVWEEFNVGNLFFKAVVELNPNLLRRIEGRSTNYYYRGKITLPHAEDN